MIEQKPSSSSPSFWKELLADIIILFFMTLFFWFCWNSFVHGFETLKRISFTKMMLVVAMFRVATRYFCHLLTEHLYIQYKQFLEGKAE